MPPLVQRSAKFILAAAFLVLGIACVEEWSLPHSAGAALSANRPECPDKWDTIPLFGVGGLVRNGSLGNGAVAGSGGIGLLLPNPPALIGPITNIPEFHDCQKFIYESGETREYGALFAIFAAFKLDSISSALGFDAVTWASGNSAVAAVNVTTGIVTGMAPGAAVVTATSQLDPTRKATVNITVTTPGGNGSAGTVYVPAGGAGGTTGTLRVGQTLQLQTAMGAQTTSTLPVAEIYTYGKGDPALGIEQNFNCLYLFLAADGGLKAEMVPVPNLGTAWDACMTLNPSTIRTKKTPLTVIRKSGGVANDYPAAARWDWDPVNHQQSIGIKCGDGWCQIGAPGTDGKIFAASNSYATDGASADEARVIGIKGWYDEQFLAIVPQTGNAIPTTMKATVIPDPALHAITKLNFQTPNSWISVAYVGLDAGTAGLSETRYYKQKFNFDVIPVRAPLTSMNQIAMCYGSRDNCQVPQPQPGTTGCQPESQYGFPVYQMWSRIISATARDTVYRCITRRDTPLPTGVIMPATARFRWLAADETIWIFCTQGCCEIEVTK